MTLGVYHLHFGALNFWVLRAIGEWTNWWLSSAVWRWEREERVVLLRVMRPLRVYWGALFLLFCAQDPRMPSTPMTQRPGTLLIAVDAIVSSKEMLWFAASTGWSGGCTMLCGKRWGIYHNCMKIMQIGGRYGIQGGTWFDYRNIIRRNWSNY